MSSMEGPDGCQIYENARLAASEYRRGANYG